MLYYNCILLLSTLGSVSSRIAPRQINIPATAPPDDSFYNGAPILPGQPPEEPPNDDSVFGARDIDIPFGKLYGGNLKFFPKGEQNTPDQNTDKWP